MILKRMKQRRNKAWEHYRVFTKRKKKMVRSITELPLLTIPNISVLAVIIKKKQRMQLTGKPENFLTLTLYIHLMTTILTIFRIFLIRNGSV